MMLSSYSRGSSRSSRRSRPRSLLVLSLVCFLCRCHLLRADSPEKSSVAVIGAGIGGSTAAYFLREALGDEVEIVVFDSASKAGGRTDVSRYTPATSCTAVGDVVMRCCGGRLLCLATRPSAHTVTGCDCFMLPSCCACA